MGLNDLGKGRVIRFQGELYVVEDYAHSKRGRGGAVASTKLRHLKTDKVLQKNFTEADPFEVVFLEERRLQFLYRESRGWVFMDGETFEQLTIPEEMLGPAARFLLEGVEVAGFFHEGRLVRVEPPNFVELTVTHTEPGVRGDTVSNTDKAATLETGAQVRVPLFVDKGDRIKVDTRTGRYVARL